MQERNLKNQIVLVISILLVVLSIIPFSEIVLFVGMALSLLVSIYSLIIYRKGKENLMFLSLLLSLLALVTDITIYMFISALI